MSRKGLIIALFISVALNLFAIGIGVGGLMMASRMHDVRAQARPGPMLWAAGASLPQDERREFRRLLREEGRDLRPSLRQARELRRHAWTYLAKEPFDAAGARAALDRARALELESRGRVEGRILEFAGRLSPQDRARLAEGLARAPGPGGDGPPRMMHPPRLDAGPPDAPPPPES